MTTIVVGRPDEAPAQRDRLPLAAFLHDETYRRPEMGMVAGRRLADLRRVGIFLLGFGVLTPVVNGLIGVGLGRVVGLELGGATLLGVLSASASYIAAPAAIRISLPDANPTLYLTASLAITFPFNIALGIPLYLAFARWLFS